MARTIVMFDLDGTLADTMPQMIEWLAGVFQEEFGWTEAEARERAPRIIRLPPEQIPAVIAELTGRAPPELTGSRRDRILAGLLSIPLVLFPEVQATLASLKSNGYSLIFSSNTPQPAVEARLEGAEIRAYFDIALGVNPPQGITKADHARMAREQLGMSEQEFGAAAVYVGDGEGDMALAKAAGIVAVDRLTGENEEELRRAGADYVISDLTQLEPLLASLA